MKYLLSELVKLPKKEEKLFCRKSNLMIGKQDGRNQIIDELSNLIVEVDEGKIKNILNRWGVFISSDKIVQAITKQLPNIMKGK